MKTPLEPILPVSFPSWPVSCSDNPIKANEGDIKAPWEEHHHDYGGDSGNAGAMWEEQHQDTRLDYDVSLDLLTSLVDTDSCGSQLLHGHDGTSLPHQGQHNEPVLKSKRSRNSAVKKSRGSGDQRPCKIRVSASRSGHGHGRAKRDFAGDQSGEDDDSEDSNCKSDSGAATGDQPKQLLACPFYKHNSMQYRSCLGLRLTRVRDVKQHLSRRHRRPVHCPICGRIFADSQQLDAHIRDRSCERPAQGFTIEGVTETQSMALARRVNRSLNHASQWFSIWGILFPDTPRPPSPYLSDHIEETVGMVYDCWVREGPKIVAELTNPIASSGGLAGHVASLSTRVVDTLLFRFSTGSRAVTDPTSASMEINPVTSIKPQITSSGVPEWLGDPGLTPSSQQQRPQQSPGSNLPVLRNGDDTQTKTNNLDISAAEMLAAQADAVTAQLQPCVSECYDHLDEPGMTGSAYFSSLESSGLMCSGGPTARKDDLGSPSLDFEEAWWSPADSISFVDQGPVAQDSAIFSADGGFPSWVTLEESSIISAGALSLLG